MSPSYQLTGGYRVVISIGRRNTLTETQRMACMLVNQRRHRGFTAAEKAELWDRWKRAGALNSIGRAFGEPSSSVYHQLAPHEGKSIYGHSRMSKKAGLIKSLGKYIELRLRLVDYNDKAIRANRRGRQNEATYSPGDIHRTNNRIPTRPRRHRDLAERIH